MRCEGRRPLLWEVLLVTGLKCLQEARGWRWGWWPWGCGGSQAKQNLEFLPLMPLFPIVKMSFQGLQLRHARAPQRRPGGEPGAHMCIRRTLLEKRGRQTSRPMYLTERGSAALPLLGASRLL